jgi:hypothetical protein
LSICNLNPTRTWWRIVLQHLQREIGIKGCAGSGGGEEITEREGWWRWSEWFITWGDFNIATFTTLSVGGIRVALLSRVLPWVRLWLLFNRGRSIRIETLIWRSALIGIGALVGNRISAERLFVGCSDEACTPAKRSWCSSGANDQGDQGCGHKPRGALSALHIRSVAGERASSVARLRRAGPLT